jgi:hypothetical protein
MADGTPAAPYRGAADARWPLAQRAAESAKETIFEVIGCTPDGQLKVECLFGYALCGAIPGSLNDRQRSLTRAIGAERAQSRRFCEHLATIVYGPSIPHESANERR